MKLLIAFAAAVGLAALAAPAALAAAPAAHPLLCLRALAPLSAGDIPSSDRFASADCAGRSIAPAFRRDAGSGVTRLARAVAPGEVVAPYPEYGVDMVLPGQSLRLVVVAGAARIERQVEALQPARPGQRFFVRSADGEILSVRFEKAAP